MGCSPIRIESSPVARRNLSSTAKNPTRRPIVRARAMKRSTTAAQSSALAIGAPATTHALPVSTYATHPETRSSNA